MDYAVIASLFLLLFLGVADNQMIAAMLPDLVKGFSVTLQQGGLLVVVYSVMAAASSFGSGALSDHYGRRPFLWAGVWLFAVASALSSQSGSFTTLLMARAITGIAAGTISTCSIAYAGDWFAYSVRGRAIGLISVAYFAAPIIGVPLGAQIADRLGWRSTFLFFAGLAVVVGLSSFRLAKDEPSQEARGRKPSDTAKAFYRFLQRRDLRAAAAVAFLVSGGLVGFITYLSAWLNQRFGLTTRGVGLVFMLSGLVAIGGAPVGGILADRWGKRRASIVSNLLLGGAIAMLPLLPWGLALLAVFALTSLGAALRQGPVTALMTELVPTAQRGSFIALRNIASQLGIGSAAFVGGILYQRFGYGSVTSLCAVMTFVVAGLLALYLPEPDPSQT